MRLFLTAYSTSILLILNNVHGQRGGRDFRTIDVPTETIPAETTVTVTAPPPPPSWSGSGTCGGRCVPSPSASVAATPATNAGLNEISVAAIVGATVGILAFIGLVAMLVVFFLKQQKKKEDSRHHRKNSVEHLVDILAAANPEKRDKILNAIGKSEPSVSGSNPGGSSQILHMDLGNQSFSSKASAPMPPQPTYIVLSVPPPAMACPENTPPIPMSPLTEVWSEMGTPPSPNAMHSQMHHIGSYHNANTALNAALSLRQSSPSHTASDVSPCPEVIVEPYDE